MLERERRQSEEQQIVRRYLEKCGCKVSDNVNRDEILTFKPIGASTMGGCIFPNGNIFIHNEHTEPFDCNIVSYYKVLCYVCGESGAKAYMRKYANEKKSALKKPKNSYKVVLDSVMSDCPPSLIIMDNASVRRSSETALSNALAVGEIKSIKTENVWNWIKNPPSWWKHEKERLDKCEDPDEYDQLKRILKTYNTPCLTNMLNVYPTIGWLDVDGKENSSDVLNKVVQLLKKDKRVLAVFHSLSGSGIAIGIGISASDAQGYEAAMKYAKDEFERDYSGLKIDKTCIRIKQLRALSYDTQVFTNEQAYFFRSINNMMTEGLQEALDGAAKRVADMGKRKVQIEAFEGTLLEELARLIKDLQIEILEDKWTGKRTYKLKGQPKKDINSLYLAVKNLAIERNSNRFKLSKQEIIDYMIAECVDERDIVMNTLFTSKWDRKDRWPELKGALHLDEFGLKAFQMWMRQGAGLLCNKGEADDLQRNYMLILFSRAQNIGKSDLARRLSCGTNSFTQKNLDMKNKDTLADLYSHWIHEFGELGTTFRKKDLNDLKNYITNTAVTIRRPYDRDTTILPVRTSIIGTTNDDQLFTDDTGNRRYIVIDCNWDRRDWPAIDSIDFKQLWLQARWEYLIERKEGRSLYPYAMDAAFQRENDRRCKDKIVKPKEMYWLAGIFSKYDPKDFAMYELIGDKVCIRMTALLRKADDQRIIINEYILIKSMRHFGFESVSTQTDTNFYIDKDKFDHLVSESSMISDPEFVPTKMNIEI